MTRSGLVLAALAASLLFCGVLASRLWAQPEAEELSLSAVPVPLNAEDPGQTEVGRLRYLGGLQLRSSDPRFGGLSGLRFTGRNKLLAVSDEGYFVSLQLNEEKERLVGVGQLRLSPIPGLNGAPIRGKADSDAEALEVGPDGEITVAFERNHRIYRSRSMGSRAGAVVFPDAAWLASLPVNEGVEAIARVRDGWVYLAEAPEPQGGYNGVLSPDRSRFNAYGRVRLTPPQGFRVTDAHALDDRTILVLERRFSPLSGVAIALQILNIDLPTLASSPGPVLATLTPPLSVDNMEGLAIRREGGRTFVYMVSDDNYSPLQRTLLLKFELKPGSYPAPPARR